MAAEDVKDVLEVDAKLDALDEPSSSEVWRATKGHTNRAIAAAAARRALEGGGGPGGPIELDDLVDVDLDGSQVGDVLTKIGEGWGAQAPSGGPIPFVGDDPPPDPDDGDLWWDTDDDTPLGGGSQLYARQRVTLDFVETPGNGVYSASIPIDAHGYITNIFCVSRSGPWDAGSVSLEAADSGHAIISLDVGFEVNGTYTYGLDPVPETLETNGGLGGDYDGGFEIPDGRTLQPLPGAEVSPGVFESIYPHDLTGRPGIIYDTADQIDVTLEISDADPGGTTGRLMLIVDGYGIEGGYTYVEKVAA